MQESPSKPIVISVANQKGGVGKTTTAVNLGAGLAQRGYRVLVMDFDIQANATHILSGPMGEEEPNLAEALLEDATLDELVKETNTPNLYIAGSGETMVRVDLALAGVLGREETLKRVLEDSEQAKSMDFIVIDSSPYLGLLTVNALVASDYVLIPVSCEYLPMLGLKLFLTTIRTVQKRLNHKLEVLGYLLTMYDRREKITFDVERIMRNHFEDLVFKRPIRINTKHKSSPAYRQTIFEFEGKEGRGVEDYNRLTKAVLQRLEMPETASPEIPAPDLPEEPDASPEPAASEASNEASAAEAPPEASSAPQTQAPPEPSPGAQPPSAPAEQGTPDGASAKAEPQN